MTNLPKFSAALLHPRYWLTWLGIGILWLIVQLPYPILFKLGCALGRLALRLMKRRAKIVSRNLELCFPQMPAAAMAKQMPAAHCVIACMDFYLLDSLLCFTHLVRSQW